MQGKELRQYRRSLKKGARKDRRSERKENRVAKRNNVLEHNTIADRKGRRKARAGALFSGIKKIGMTIAALFVLYILFILFF